MHIKERKGRGKERESERADLYAWVTCTHMHKIASYMCYFIGNIEWSSVEGRERFPLMIDD